MLVWHAGIEAAVDQVLRVSDRLRCAAETQRATYFFGGFFVGVMRTGFISVSLRIKMSGQHIIKGV